MNTYELELREALKLELASGAIEDLGDSSPFFARLAERFPTSGSKIDWAGAPHSIEQVESDVAAQVARFIDFFDEICERFQLSGPIVYIGDSATDFALGGSIDAARAVLPEILSIPQHHYIVAREFGWCFCFAMEGDMAFGFSPLSEVP